MGKGRHVPAPPKQLTDEDKTFIKLINEGARKSTAFKEAYPNDHRVITAKTAEPGSPAYQHAAEAIADASKFKLQAKYISRALTTYQDSMEQFSILSLETATELVKSARSEKVRADLAIEGIRQKVGTPVQKVAMKEERTVILTFAKPTKVIDSEDVS